MQDPGQRRQGGGWIPSRRLWVGEVVTALVVEEPVKGRVQGAAEVRSGPRGEPFGPLGVDDDVTVGVVDVVGQGLVGPPVDGRRGVLRNSLYGPAKEVFEPECLGRRLGDQLHEAPVSRL